MRYTPLTRNSDFARAYKRGKSYVHHHVVLYVNKNRVGHTRVGITASKKIGGAVQRNRARRVIRHALYQVLLGQEEGPRFGGFVALYGIAGTIGLIETALARQESPAA